MIQLVAMYVDIVMLAISGVLCTLVYLRCLEEGMLLSRLGKWLASKDSFIFKPLGNCPYCTTPYITAIMAGVYYWYLPAWAFITILALSMTLMDLLTYHDII